VSLSDNIRKFLFFVALKSLSGLLISLYHSKAGFVAICLWHILHCCFSSKETTFFSLSFCLSLYVFSFLFCLIVSFYSHPQHVSGSIRTRKHSFVSVGKYTSRQVGSQKRKHVIRTILTLELQCLIKSYVW
jgi:hypothetical protein